MRRILAGLVILGLCVGVIAQDAPDFTAASTGDTTYTLYDMLDKGKYVLLDFFFTTWGPCQTSVPKFNSLWEDYGCNYHNMVVLAIDGKAENNATVDNSKLGKMMKYPKISGVEGGGVAIAKNYGIRAYPSTRLIAPNRKIVSSSYHPEDKKIRQALTQGGITEEECDPTSKENNEGLQTLQGMHSIIKSVSSKQLILAIPKDNTYTIAIYSLNGQVYKQLDKQFFSKGDNTIIWNRENMIPKVFILQINSHSLSLIEKFVID